VTWWFEDAVPDSIIEHPRGRTLTVDEHARLAWLTDNASPVHGDTHRAAQGAFGGTVVLGALTAAIVAGLAEPATAVAPHAHRALARGWTRIVLVSTVRGGDTLAATSEIHERRPDPDGRGGLVRRTIVGRNQRGEVVVRLEEARWIPDRDTRTTDC